MANLPLRDSSAGNVNSLSFFILILLPVYEVLRIAATVSLSRISQAVLSVR